MKINRKAVFACIVSIMAFCAIGSGIFYYRYIFSVDKYIATVTSTYPLLDRLNLGVFVDTPPPQGVTLTNLYVGVTSVEDRYRFGRIVEAQYQANVANNEIVGYYENLLRAAAWEQSRDNDDYDGSQSQFYVKNTSCIRIDTSSRSQEFSIMIWHDFWSQDFSPQKDLWVIKEIEEGRAGGFVTCGT